MALRCLSIRTGIQLWQTASQLMWRVHGNVTVTFALSSVVLVGISGMAIDYGRWQNEQTSLQGTADAASLAAAQKLSKSGLTQKNVEDLVNDFVSPNTAGLPNVTVSSVVVDSIRASVEVNLTKPGQRTFTVMFLKSDPVISARSTSQLAVASGPPMCLLALNSSMSGALTGSGGTTFKANGCSATVNSTSNSAVVLSGGSSLTSARNCVAGSVSQGTVTPNIDRSCAPVPDPFAGLASKITVGACDYTAFSASADMTLSPGTYCNGFTLRNKTYTLAPGLYIIKNGKFTSSGGATIVGTGVTIFLTGTSAGINWSGGGNYRLKAMSTGPLAGFLVYLDPSATKISKSVISGGGDTTYEGVMYFAGQKLELSGGSTATTPSPFTALIADNFVFSGGSQLSINLDKSKTTVPIPTGLYTTRTPRLIN